VPRPEIGDLVVVGGAGAYCAAMATINYNSYPQAPEVMLEPDGALRLLRRHQSPEQGLAERARLNDEPSFSRQLRAANAVPVQRLVVVHCDGHLDERACELEGALVVRDRRATIASDIEARP
jgi:hypothetical protein